MATKTKATVYIEETTSRAEELHFKAGECYNCEFIDPEFEGQEGQFFDQVETGFKGHWIPLKDLVRSGAKIQYKINE